MAVGGAVGRQRGFGLDDELDLRSLGAPLAMFCVLALAILTYWVQECLPVRIYAGKKQGTLAWKFITARLVCELALFFLALYIMLGGWEKYILLLRNFAVGICLCRGECHRVMERHSNGLYPLYPLVGMCRGGDMVLRYVGQKIFVFPGGAFVQGFWMAAVFIAAIYVVMPRLSVQK